MDFISFFFDVILHLDDHLTNLVGSYGIWVYAILFFIIFCETGLVLTPFLPGDSLLFAAGALAATGSMEVSVLFFLLFGAAVIGDSVNYSIGKWLGPRVLRHESIRFLKQEHVEKTEKFYAKYGSKTIVLARFVPIVRTFAPFVAGVGNMSYRHFIFYNVLGGFVWVALFLFGGYFFGNIPFVQDNFSVVIIGIILVSFVPAVIEYVKYRREKKVQPV